jgi:GxxExxY protein
VLEPSKELDAIARASIGAALEVHRVLGPGFLESTYEEASAIELELRGIPFERQKVVAIPYKGRLAGEGKLDFVVQGQLVLELKAVDRLLPIHWAQIIAYLKATGHHLGLLFNFHETQLKFGIKRIVSTPRFLSNMAPWRLGGSNSVVADA